MHTHPLVTSKPDVGSYNVGNQDLQLQHHGTAHERVPHTLALQFKFLHEASFIITLRNNHVTIWGYAAV